MKDYLLISNTKENKISDFCLNFVSSHIEKTTNKTICFVTHSIPEAVYLSTKIVVMSPRPGRIVDVIENTLPTDRPLEIRDSKEFISVSQRVREGLRSGHSYE